MICDRGAANCTLIRLHRCYMSELVRERVDEPAHVHVHGCLYHSSVQEVAQREVVRGAGLAVEPRGELELAERPADAERPCHEIDGVEDGVCASDGRSVVANASMETHVAVREQADMTAGTDVHDTVGRRGPTWKRSRDDHWRLIGTCI